MKELNGLITDILFYDSSDDYFADYIIVIMMVMIIFNIVITWLIATH